MMTKLEEKIRAAKMIQISNNSSIFTFVKISYYYNINHEKIILEKLKGDEIRIITPSRSIKYLTKKLKYCK
jgi:hypothetical protein